MLSAALLLCLSSSLARAEIGEMRWMDGARRKWSIFLGRNDEGRGREGRFLKGNEDK